MDQKGLTRVNRLISECRNQVIQKNRKKARYLYIRIIRRYLELANEDKIKVYATILKLYNDRKTELQLDELPVKMQESKPIKIPKQQKTKIPLTKLISHFLSHHWLVLSLCALLVFSVIVSLLYTNYHADETAQLSGILASKGFVRLLTAVILAALILLAAYIIHSVHHLKKQYQLTVKQARHGAIIVILLLGIFSFVTVIILFLLYVISSGLTAFDIFSRDVHLDIPFNPQTGVIIILVVIVLGLLLMWARHRFMYHSIRKIIIEPPKKKAITQSEQKASNVLDYSKKPKQTSIPKATPKQLDDKKMISNIINKISNAKEYLDSVELDKVESLYKEITKDFEAVSPRNRPLVKPEIENLAEEMSVAKSIFS